MLHHPAWEPEFEDTFPQIVRGFSVLPAEIGDRHFDVEILEMRNPGGSADDQGALAKKEPLKNLCGIQTLPAGAWLLASEIDIGQTHTERGAGETICWSPCQKLAGSAEKRMQDHVTGT